MNQEEKYNLICEVLRAAREISAAGHGNVRFVKEKKNDKR